jgi:hypothetical protein
VPFQWQQFPGQQVLFLSPRDKTLCIKPKSSHLRFECQWISNRTCGSNPRLRLVCQLVQCPGS